MTNINAQGSRLAQTRPADTNAATAFTATINTEVTRVTVCNVTSSATTFRLFHAEDAESLNEDTALYWDVALAANTTIDILSESNNAGITLKATDKLGVRSGTADAVNFTVYGVTAAVTDRFQY